MSSSENDVDQVTQHPVTEQIPDKHDRYKNRRRMAWLSFFCLVVFAAKVVFWGWDVKDAEAEIIMTIIWAFVLVVLGYMGITEVKEIWGSRK